MCKIIGCLLHQWEKSKYLLFKEDEIYLNLVMNYIPETLYTLQRKLIKKKEFISSENSIDIKFS